MVFNYSKNANAELSKVMPFHDNYQRQWLRSHAVSVIASQIR